MKSDVAPSCWPSMVKRTVASRPSSSNIFHIQNPLWIFARNCFEWRKLIVKIAMNTKNKARLNYNFIPVTYIDDDCILYNINYILTIIVQIKIIYREWKILALYVMGTYLFNKHEGKILSVIKLGSPAFVRLACLNILL